EEGAVARVALVRELLERLLDLVGQVEQELGLPLDLGQRLPQLGRGDSRHVGPSVVGFTGRARVPAEGERASPRPARLLAHAAAPSGAAGEAFRADSRAPQNSPTSRMFSLSTVRFVACISISCRMKIRVPGSDSSW